MQAREREIVLFDLQSIVTPQQWRELTDENAVSEVVSFNSAMQDDGAVLLKQRSERYLKFLHALIEEGDANRHISIMSDRPILEGSIEGLDDDAAISVLKLKKLRHTNLTCHSPFYWVTGKSEEKEEGGGGREESLDAVINKLKVLKRASSEGQLLTKEDLSSLIDKSDHGDEGSSFVLENVGKPFQVLGAALETPLGVSEEKQQEPSTLLKIILIDTKKNNQFTQSSFRKLQDASLVNGDIELGCIDAPENVDDLEQHFKSLAEKLQAVDEMAEKLAVPKSSSGGISAFCKAHPKVLAVIGIIGGLVLLTGGILLACASHGIGLPLLIPMMGKVGTMIGGYVTILAGVGLIGGSSYCGFFKPKPAADDVDKSRAGVDDAAKGPLVHV